MTTRTACSSAALVTIAAVLSAATLGLAVAPAAGAAAPSRMVFDLPAVHIAAQRTPASTAVVDLPRVVIAGHRLRPMAIVDLPRVVVTARRAPDAATELVVAGR